MSMAKKESHRIVNARTDAIMSALITLRTELASEVEISRVSSAYMTLRGIIYDLLDGAYWEGYGAGEDGAGRIPEGEDRASND